MLNSALIPEHEINKENVISQDYNLLSDNNPNVIWNGNKVQLRRPNGLSNPTKLKFRSFQTELLPYTSLNLPQLKTELYLTTSTNADSVKVGGKYNRFGIGPLLKTEYNTSDNKSEVLDSFTKAWTYNSDYDSQIEYNIKECIDYANIRLNEWIEIIETDYIYKNYEDYLLREYINENIGILPKYNYSDSICSIVGDKVAIATYNDTTNKLDVNLTDSHFNRISNCLLICASSNRELIYAVGALDNNLYTFSFCYYLRNSDKKYIKFLQPHWGWSSETHLMPVATVGCTMSRNYSLINSANSSGEGWERGRFYLMYHGDVNDNPPVTYQFQNSVIAPFSNHEVVCVAIGETISTLPGNFYALFANYNNTTRKVDLYLGQIRIGGDNTISYIPTVTGTMELDYWNSNKFMECAMGMSFDDEISLVSSPNGTLYNFSNKVILRVSNGEIADVHRYYNYKFYNYQDPDNNYCLFGGLAGSDNERNFYMVKESDINTETLYNQGYYDSNILITRTNKPIYSFGYNSGFVQTNKEDGVQTTGGLKGKAMYIIYEKLINLRDGAYVEGEQTYTLANQDLNHATAPEEQLINMVDTGGIKNIIHPQLLFGDDKVANIGIRIYTEPYYFEVFHDDNYYISPLYSLYPVSDIMKTHFINSHVYNTLETIILMQYEYNDLMLRVNQFPNNDNVVFSSGDIARVAFKTMDINTTTEFLNCELATNNDDAITKEDLKRIYGKVSVSCDWIQ